MIKATFFVKNKRICRLLQKELGELFLTETESLFGNAFISVTEVYLSSDFGVAKVYLSFSLNDNKETLIKKVSYQKNTIRSLLGKRIASKMRTVPDLKFYTDNTVIQGARVITLIDQLNK